MFKFNPTLKILLFLSLLVVFFGCKKMDFRKTQRIPEHHFIKTEHLIVRDITGQLTDEQFDKLSKTAEESFKKIIAFWSADPRRTYPGKINVELRHPFRRGSKEIYSSVCFWNKDSRIVRVYGVKNKPQLMVHKLTHALFPHKDKLIRNMMGIPMEKRFGNYLSFPMCGFDNDAWVLTFRDVKSYIPLMELGPNHKQWGMRFIEGRPRVDNRYKQHISYAEAGSFGSYLIKTYGIDKIKAFRDLSLQKGRPWLEIFGLTLKELEKGWIKYLTSKQKIEQKNILILKKIIEKDPYAARFNAQDLAMKDSKRK
jgi:hypothetical protein